MRSPHADLRRVDPRSRDALADRAEAAVAQMTEVVRDGKEQIKRLHRIMAQIESLESVKP